VRLTPVGDEEALSTSDEIYLCNVLPGEHSGDGRSIVYNIETLGQRGVAELFDYLSGRGFQLDLNNGAKDARNKVAFEKRELATAKLIGGRVKGDPAPPGHINGFKRTLKPFQRPAVSHMLHVPHAANFSVPGSGKTTITLAAFAKLRSRDGIEALVVVGPRSSFATWEAELSACLTDQNPRVVRIAGSKRDRARGWRVAQDATLLLLNYHAAANDLRSLGDLLSKKRCMLVLDESHYVKNISDSKWSAAVREVAPLATKRVILSGTPAPNSLVDLWSQFTFLYPGALALGTRDEFLQRLQDSGTDATQVVRDEISPLFWRIKKSQLRLPKPTVRKIRVALGQVQSAIYDALAARVLADSEKAPKELLKLKQWRRARMIRLLQAASNPSLLARYSNEFRLPPLAASGLPVSQLIDKYPEFEVPAKITQAASLVKNLAARGRKIILWTTFVYNIQTLLTLLRDISPLPLYGAIPASKAEDADVNREKIIDCFLHDKSSRVLIANPAACAESISLHTACHDAIYLDRSFNAAHFLQSKERIHRVGLKATDRINYYILLARDTIDEVVDDRLEEKQQRLLKLLETDLATVDLDSSEDVVSEEADEEIDFRETLRQIRRLSRR